MNTAEAEAFLNENGRAQAVWTHMMEAGEEFLKADLAGKTGIHTPEPGAVCPASSISRSGVGIGVHLISVSHHY